MYGLRAHFYSCHVSEEEKVFACEHCPERFAHRTHRNDHVRVKHLKKYQCDFCGRR